MTGHRIQRLLEARTLEASATEDEEVVRLWEAALREWADSSVAELSTTGAFMHVYQAGFRAATAALRSAGYRIRGGVGSHHYNTFYALGALAEGRVEELASVMQTIRGGRNTALYGDEEEIDDEALATARVRVRALLTAVAVLIVSEHPHLNRRIQPPV